MAKIKFTAFMADARGKLAGTVFSRNRGGAYVRTKVTPSNPRTSAQLAVRALFAAFSAGWRALSDSQRDAWRAITSEYQRTDQFGDQKTLTGAQLYNSLNLNLSNANGSPIDLPKPPEGAVPVEIVTVTTSNTVDNETFKFGVAYTPSPLSSTEAVVVEATPPLSAGVANADNQFRKIAVLPPEAAAPADLADQYEARFGKLSAGQTVQVRMKTVNLNTGEASFPWTASAVVSLEE